MIPIRIKVQIFWLPDDFRFRENEVTTETKNLGAFLGRFEKNRDPTRRGKNIFAKKKIAISAENHFLVDATFRYFFAISDTLPFFQ